ncbi:MAG: hypothetical protein EHM79_15895 [Geobacter sp.]|nr:MAG: hypothetical protein EHM79_15895 [Geobacter sp.]
MSVQIHAWYIFDGFAKNQSPSRRWREENIIITPRHARSEVPEFKDQDIADALGGLPEEKESLA